MWRRMMRIFRSIKGNNPILPAFFVLSYSPIFYMTYMGYKYDMYNATPKELERYLDYRND